MPVARPASDRFTGLLRESRRAGSMRSTMIALSLLLGACEGPRQTEAEVAASPITAEFNQAAGKHIERLYNEAQSKKELEARCKKDFEGLRIGSHLQNGSDLAKCADITYTRTAGKNHEVWIWKSDSSRTLFVDNGILTTINGSIPSSPD